MNTHTLQIYKYTKGHTPFFHFIFLYFSLSISASTTPLFISNKKIEDRFYG